MPATYDPLQNGIAKKQQHAISYSEQPPHKDLSSIVYRFWTLKSQASLDEDFIYTIMPDACVDIVFDMTNHSSPLIMTPHLQVEALNLGRSFHYCGIRFAPGVFTQTGLDIGSVVGHQNNIEDVLKIKLETIPINSATIYKSLEAFVHTLRKSGVVDNNRFIEQILYDIQQGTSLDEIAQKAGYSTRQLRRKVFLQTGFSPIQLQRVVRFQQALSQSDVSLRFADQSHLIKEFKAITGSSHKSFINTFS